MRRTLVALSAAATVALAGPGFAQEVRTAPGTSPTPLRLAEPQDTTASRSATRMYVVELRGAPAARYDGGVRGLARTAPARGERYDARAAAVQQYIAHLRGEHDRVLADIGAAGRKVYDYVHVANGFAARLTADEANRLRNDKRVAQVWEDYAVEIDSNSTPEFLGLLDEEGGLREDLGLYGRDVVIGVLDTGAIQEHPSFSDSNRFLPYSPPPATWNGICQEGEAWSADDCNNKLIGARFYVEGFRNPDGSLNLVEGEFVSPRDSSGHGSHTASTAGGNGVIGTLGGTPVAKLSGMASRARIAAYKVCWLAPGASNFSCFFSDSAAATDAAVADGVDVLNFSVGTASAFNDLQDLAFLNAASAGVFVARSAGNDGPGPATTPAGEPWVTTVGASTTDGPQFVLAARVNSPANVAGDYGALEGAFTQPLSESGDITDDLVAADPLRACEPLTNDIGGKIAFISRGDCAFVTKIENAFLAGASAVLVYSTGEKVVMGGDSSEFTNIPAVMIDLEDGEALLAEIEAGNTVNVTLGAGILLEETRIGNVMAGFSSRGPYETESDWLKPDITAPGVSILAATTPEPADGGASGELYGYLSGTSMSSPHIAGLAALIVEAHPDWSPAQVKSALMTTARQDVFKEDGVTPADPFDFGAGHVDPNLAVNPGLTYDLEGSDYLAASCGTATPLADEFTCGVFESEGRPTDPANLNLPSIAIGELPGTQTITRTVTAVRDFRAFTPRSTYVAEIEAPPGYSVEVTPSSFSIRPGQTATYTVTITNETAPPGQFAFGALTWSDELGHVVRSPIAVRASALIAPDEIAQVGTDGDDAFDITFGYTGEYTAQVHGLNDADLFLGTVEDDPFNSFEFLGPGTTIAFQQEIPEGTAVARFALFNEYTSGNDDLDIYVYYCPDLLCTEIGSSGNVDSNESFDVVFPINDPNIEDPYVVFVHGFETENQEPADFLLFYSTFGVVDDAGNLTITEAPASAEIGETATIGFEWSGLNSGPGFKQLGAISHSDANGIQDLTVISVTNDEGFGLCDVPGVCEEP